MAGKGNILLCGDMNARTGSKNDYIEKDTNFFVPSPIPYEKDFESGRQSADISVNTQGRQLIDLCISLRLRILNGRHKGDSPGNLPVILQEARVW